MNQTPEEKREAAAIRRRWITLGEVLAVAAVAISGLTFWNSYQERKGAEAERVAHAREAEANARKAEQSQAALVLKATPENDGRRLSLTALDPEQAIQSQRILFPTALGVDPVETVADARIEARWFADPLEKAIDDRKWSGDARLPVALVTRFVVNGTMRSDAAVYQLGLRRDDGLFGSAIRLRGLSLVGRTSAKAAQAKVDALWKK